MDVAMTISLKTGGYQGMCFSTPKRTKAASANAMSTAQPSSERRKGWAGAGDTAGCGLDIEAPYRKRDVLGWRISHHPSPKPGEKMGHPRLRVGTGLRRLRSAPRRTVRR